MLSDVRQFNDICLSTSETMGNNKDKSLSWDAFTQLGNPENAPEEEIIEESPSTPSYDAKIRVYIERKGRRGKTVTLIKGLDLEDELLDQLTKTLKGACGVGGGIEGEDIMLQGDQRKKVIEKLQALGYKDIKNAGA